MTNTFGSGIIFIHYFLCILKHGWQTVIFSIRFEIYILLSSKPTVLYLVPLFNLFYFFHELFERYFRSECLRCESGNTCSGRISNRRNRARRGHYEL